MNERDVHGPIDTLILEFPSTAAGVETARALRELVDRGIVRLYDLMVLRKAGDGTCTEVQWTEAVSAGADALAAFAGARSGLLGDDDMAAIGDILTPGTIGVAIVYENAWAIPFVAAARAEGGDAIAGSRLTAQEVMDALEAIEATV
jgi:hypothetical protein